MYHYRCYKLLSIDIDGDSVSMEYRMNVMVPYEVLAEAENTSERRAYNSTECQSMLFVRYEIGRTDDQRGYNMEQSHENSPTDEMTHFNQMTI
jgi:hypothetical protein